MYLGGWEENEMHLVQSGDYTAYKERASSATEGKRKPMC